jgi:hypothetical protein
MVRWLGAYVPDMYGEEDGTTHHVSERVIRTVMRHFLRLYRHDGEGPEVPADLVENKANRRAGPID